MTARVFNRTTILSVAMISGISGLYWSCGRAHASPGGTGFQERGLVNGTFEAWDNNLPQGWQVEIGAQNGGDAPLSIVRRGDGPALQLAGDANTRAWRLARQPVKIQPGGAYRLRCTAQAIDVRREGNQYDNCYVGVMLTDARGGKLGLQFATIAVDQFVPYSVYFRAPRQASSCDVMIFLSKTGQLTVKDCQLDLLDPADSFDVLVDEMDRSYAHFEFRDVDWPKLVEQYRPRAQSAKTPQAFAAVVAEMLDELQDIHTWVTVGDRRISKFRSDYQPNYDFKVVDQDLQNRRPVGNWGVVGRTSDGFGYVRITSLIDIDESALQQMVRAIESLFDAPGLIVDLRQNGGGAEPVAMRIASLFADRELVYARQKFRSGAGQSDFVESQPRSIRPREGRTFQGPIACLIGPGAVSSAEGFALMMNALPHCTTLGQPTRGASGNPAPVPLPNGVDVFFSRWVSLDPEGTPIEVLGVQPDVLVDHRRGADVTYDEARELLGQESNR